MEVDEIENQLTTEEGEINETEPSTDVQNNTLITHDFGTGNRVKQIDCILGVIM